MDIIASKNALPHLFTPFLLKDKVAKNDEEHESLRSRCNLLEEQCRMKEAGWKESDARLQKELQQSHTRLKGWYLFIYSAVCFF